MKKYIIFNLFACLTISGLFAQQNFIFHTPQEKFNTGKELFDQGKFAASSRFFEDFIQTASPTQAGAIQEAKYYLATVAFELRSRNAYDRLTHYISRHPYSPFADRVQFMLGMLSFERPNYNRALTNFRQINENNLNDRDRTEKQFSEGYAFLQTGNYARASTAFRNLMQQDTRFNLSAKYYFAYSEYMRGNFDTALPHFLELEHIDAYKHIVPYYIIQIFYSQGKYDEAKRRAEPLLAHNPNNPNNAEVYRILGNIAYKQGNFAEAIAMLRRYEALSPQVSRNDIYILGMSFYKTQDFPNAILYLSRIANRQDEMTENAFLHIGNSHIKLGDIRNARLAYEAALSTNFDPTVREEALYNFALTTYETNSPFGESIAAFERLLTEFPNTRFADSAYDFLASIYMTTQNFAAAYESISRIRNMTPQLLETRQFLLYQLGAESFARRNYADAIGRFTAGLENPQNRQYTAEILFWRAEANYRTGNFANTVRDLQAFHANPESRNSPNLRSSHYLLGYAHFSLRQYGEALTAFNRFVSSGVSNREPTYADAWNRIGDCYFHMRDFPNAIRAYNRAMTASPATGDYALFQIAHINGLQRNHTAKITMLERLLVDFPRSQFADNALYAIGRSYLMLESNDRALAAYNRLLTTFPRSSLAPKAALEIGMIHLNRNDLDRAIESFKRVITNYPGSEESRTALESLEIAFLEKNNIAGFIDYTRTLSGNLQTSASREDSLLFISAERQFMRRNFREAVTSLNHYLTNHCTENEGLFCMTARFYLAESFFELNDRNNALVQYRILAGVPGNRHMEDAVKRAAEITFDNRDFSTSLHYFAQLQEIASTNENRNIGRLGILRCSYFLNDHQRTLAVAQEIIDDPHTREEVKIEARYNRAKSLLALNQRATAIDDLRIVSENTRTRHGAEAKFLLAQAQFDMNNLDASEATIMDFIQRNTPYQYWLARAFVLLADIYIARGDDFQAKQYLLSLQQNYTANDDIQTMINTRLEAINRRSPL